MVCGNFHPLLSSLHFSFSVAHSLSPNGGHCPNFDFELSFAFTSLSLELWSSNLRMTQNLLGSLVNVQISGCTLREWELVGHRWGLGGCISNKLPRGPACRWSMGHSTVVLP